MPPGRVSSRYLLSGLLRAGRCHAAMFGVGAKSGRFHYYVCATAHRMGRQACGTKSIPQAVIEDKVLEKVRDVILRDDHLEELIRLTNEELTASVAQVNEQTSGLDSQLGEIDRRLGRLYDALETGNLALEDLGPRIKILREKRDMLHRARADAQRVVQGGGTSPIDREVVLGYLADLKDALSGGSIGERRAFLRSFIQSVERDEGRATVRYTLPLPPESVPVDPVRVLDLVSSGGP